MHFNLIVSFEQIIHSPQESHRLVFVINVCVHTRVCWRISMYTDLSHAHLSGWSFGGGALGWLEEMGQELCGAFSMAGTLQSTL